MLASLKALFKETAQASAKDQEGLETEEQKMQVAFAALLAEAASIDENHDQQEKNLITGLLKKQFNLSPSDADDLRVKGEEAQKNALDLHQFTREVKTLPEEERIAFIEGLWQVVLSDGVRDPYEDSLRRQICSLIHLSDRDSGEARRRVENKG